MSFYDKVKSFLGLTDKESLDQQSTERNWPPPYRNEDRDIFESPHHSRQFSVFSDPLEIHKYFEQQMDDMLKNFGFFGDGFTHFFNFPQEEDMPQIMDIPNGYEEDAAPPSGNLRDQFLKPGFEKSNAHQEKKDEDIDGKLDIKDWGSVFKGENSVAPYSQRVPKNYFYGQSITSKTITNTDGSVETHRTVRDHEGNEETVITRRTGDKEYTITKKKDKEGKEEIIENLVNLDENEVDKFFLKRKIPELNDKPSWPLFDRFFK